MNTTYHNIRDKTGRFTSKKKKTVAKTSNKKSAKKPNKKKEAQKVDVIGVVLDSSGSMSSILSKAISIVNHRINTFKEYAGNNKQPAYITTSVFSDFVVKIGENEYYEAVTPITLKDCLRGLTALHDATCETILSMEKKGKELEKNNKDVAYLLIVVTDGWENASRQYVGKMGKYISDRQGTNWSIGIMCPNYCVEHIVKQGVPRGNVQPWEATEEGVKKVDVASRTATTNYYSARMVGTKSVDDLFVDMSKVKKTDIKKMIDVSVAFQSWKIEKETPISDFVNAKLANNIVAKRVGGTQYELGRAYYQLTKKELIQENKSILVQNKVDNKLYSGQEARNLIGLGTDGAKVSPLDLGKYNIYVQSTSTNRKLVRGTTLMYLKKKK